jgi:hypothetical protein
VEPEVSNMGTGGASAACDDEKTVARPGGTVHGWPSP